MRLRSCKPLPPGYNCVRAPHAPVPVHSPLKVIIMIFPGYTAREGGRIFAGLQRLLPQIEPRQTQLVGDLAIRWHLDRAGIHREPAETTSINLAVLGRSSLRLSLPREFRIAHYHPGTDSPRDFYVAVVDPVTRLKFDIFGLRHKAPPIEAEISGFFLPFQNPVEQYASTIEDLLKITQDELVDPKQLLDAKLLEELLLPGQFEHIWEAWNARKGHDQLTIDLAVKAIKEVAATNPQLVGVRPSRLLATNCRQCVHDDQFPITPAWKIHFLMMVGQ